MTGLALDYCESYLTGDCCVMALGDSPELPEEFIGHVDMVLFDNIILMGQLLDHVEATDELGDPVGLARALIRLGLGVPLKRDDEIFDFLVHYATEFDHEHVRESLSSR